MKIAVLALQGAFIEHEQMLRRLGSDVFEVRQRADWNKPKDGLIIPGGESTTMGKLLHDLGLFAVMQDSIRAGLPVFGTCAGLILLAKNITPVPSSKGEGSLHTSIQSPQTSLATMDIEVVRNAYGRQLGSFYAESSFDFTSCSSARPLMACKARTVIPHLSSPVPMTFIRAPYISKVYDKTRALAEVDGRIVAARQDNQLVTAFHPELNDDTRVHEYFLHMVRGHMG